MAWNCGSSRSCFFLLAKLQKRADPRGGISASGVLFYGSSMVYQPYVNEFICENTSIYENVQENCRRFVEEKGNESSFVSGENQNTVINNMELPQLLTNGLLNNNTAEVYQYLAVTTFSDYIAQYLARMVVNGISFMISFVLATLLIRCITWMLNLISRLPIINGVNRLADAFFEQPNISWYYGSCFWS